MRCGRGGPFPSVAFSFQRPLPRRGLRRFYTEKTVAWVISKAIDSKTGAGKLCGMCRPLEREREFRLLLGTPSSLFVSYAFFVVWLPPFILPPIQHLSCIGCLCGVSARPNPAAFRLSRSICNRWLPGTAGGGGSKGRGGLSRCAQKSYFLAGKGDRWWLPTKSSVSKDRFCILAKGELLVKPSRRSRGRAFLFFSLLVFSDPFFFLQAFGFQRIPFFSPLLCCVRLVGSGFPPPRERNREFGGGGGGGGRALFKGGRSTACVTMNVCHAALLLPWCCTVYTVRLGIRTRHCGIRVAR